MRERVSGVLTPEIHRDLSSVEALWRGLEADPAVFATPYQRFDWVAAYVGAHPGGHGAALRVVTLRDAAGRVRLVLPLTVSRERGVAVARVVGDKHANYHMPLFASREAAAMGGADLTDLLAGVGREAGIDVYDLTHQPRAWDGTANPLGQRGEPCPSDAYGLALDPDPDATLRRVFSAEARKKLRAKERKLIEAHGPIAYRAATSPDEAARFLAAFYAQKAARFASLGIADPYAGEPARRFLAAGTRGSELSGDAPAIEVHALVAGGGDRVLATFAGAVDRGRFSGMMTSFDGDPEIGRFSPGDLLLHHLIGHQAAQGRRAFDLGVGEARYKASICDETIELVETVVPVTLRGHLYALQAVGSARLKRRIKHSPRLWEMVRRLRRLRAA